MVQKNTFSGPLDGSIVASTSVINPTSTSVGVIVSTMGDL